MNNSEELKTLFEKQKQESDINEKTRDIGYWVVNRLNKVSLVAITLSLFYDVNRRFKIFQTIEARRYIFILVKYYMISVCRLRNWLLVTNEDFKKGIVPKDNKLANIYKGYFIYFIVSPVKKNMDTHLKNDYDFGEKYFDALMNDLKEWLAKIPKPEKTREIKELELICKKDFKKSETLKDLKAKTVTILLKKLQEFVDVKSEITSDDRDIHTLIYHLWVLSNLKQNLKVHSVSKVDFHKYFDFINKADLKQIKKLELPW